MARRGVERGQVRPHRLGLFHEGAQRVDGRTRHGHQQPGEVAEDHPLPLGELGAQKRAEEIFVQRDRTVDELLAIGGPVPLQTVKPEIEEVEGGRVLDVVRVDEHQTIGKRALGPGRKLGEVHDRPDHVALAVDDDERSFAVAKGVEIAQHEVLQQLRFAVAGTAHDVRVLEAPGEGDGAGKLGREDRQKRSAFEE